MAAKIKKGDKVVVLTGRAKGRVRRGDPGDAEGGPRAVRGVNMVRRHQRRRRARRAA